MKNTLLCFVGFLCGKEEKNDMSNCLCNAKCAYLYRSYKCNKTSLYWKREVKSMHQRLHYHTEIQNSTINNDETNIQLQQIITVIKMIILLILNSTNNNVVSSHWRQKRGIAEKWCFLLPSQSASSPSPIDSERSNCTSYQNKKR